MVLYLILGTTFFFVILGGIHTMVDAVATVAVPGADKLIRDAHKIMVALQDSTSSDSATANSWLTRYDQNNTDRLLVIEAHNVFSTIDAPTSLHEPIQTWLRDYDTRKAEKPNRFFALPRIVVALIIASGTTVLIWVGSNAPNAQLPAPEQKPQIVANEPQVPTTLQMVQNVLGPFQTITVSRSTPTPDTGYPAVLLLGVDNGTKASTAWTINLDPTLWDSKGSFYVNGGEPTLGFVTFQTATGQIFTVHVGQPFVLEKDPETVLFLDGNGLPHSVTFTRAQGMREPLPSTKP
jgi:hypothetical protein